MKQRVRWLDVLRCIGIFLIYVGHFTTSAGNTYSYVFTHHVPLFFFAAGCAENFCADREFLTTIKKTLLEILLPWAFFGLLSLAVRTIAFNMPAHKVWEQLKFLAEGTIRNAYFAPSLWFLTCIAVVRILFSLIKKVRFKWLILSICIGIFCFASLVMVPNPLKAPSLPFNVDSGLYYILYYAIGYVSFPLLNKLLLADKPWKKGILAGSFLVSAFYAACTYFKISKVTGLLATIPVIKIFAPVISALIIIWMYCVLAKLLENMTLLNTVGQNSLYLCGSEYIVKHLASATVGILGLKISVSSGLMVYIYCILLIVLTNRFLVPCEKSFLLWIQKHLARLSVSGKQRDPNKAAGQ